MTTGGKIDAAAVARLRETQLTEIAQGDIPKLAEALVNRDLLPGNLAAIFQVAAAVVDSDNHQKVQEIFSQQQQRKAEHEQKAEKKKEKEARDKWLEAMSPEYRQAYAGLMTAIDNADKDYARDRKLLRDHLQKLDAKEKDLDDNALHLKDGSRVYQNAQGELVDRSGKRLKGEAEKEAEALRKQHNGPITSFEAQHDNDKGHTDTIALLRKIDANQVRDHKYGTDATDPAHPDVAGTKQHGQTVAADAAAVTTTTEVLAAGDKDRHDLTHANDVSLAGLSDLNGDSGPSTAPAPHSSFASTIDPSAGIHANNVSASFTAAAQGVTPVVTPPSPSQRPAVSAPAPA